MNCSSSALKEDVMFAALLFLKENFHALHELRGIMVCTINN